MQYFLVHKQINGSLVNKLFKKEIIECKRLDESIKYGEDALFFWKNLLDIRSIAVSPDVLYHVTLHDDSASGGGSYKPIRRDCIRVWKLISQDAVQVSVELGCMARAQLGNMAFFSLYEMGYYGCKNEEHQKEYLNTLRNTININVYLTFFLTLVSVVLTYIYSAKTSLLNAYKNNYIANYFIQFLRTSTLMFRSSTGTFYYDRWKPLIEGVINIVLSIALVNVVGITGVIVATIVTNLLINDIVEPYVVFKHALQRKPTQYYIMNYSYILLFALSLLVIQRVSMENNSIITEFFANGSVAVGISVIPCVFMVITNRDFRTILCSYVKKTLRKAIR